MLRNTGSSSQAPWLWHRLGCYVECGIFSGQRLNSCPLHWQVDSLPLSHQGSWQLHFESSFFSLEDPGKEDTLPHGTSTWIVGGVLISEIFKSCPGRGMAALISCMICASGSGTRWSPSGLPHGGGRGRQPPEFFCARAWGPFGVRGESEEDGEPPALGTLPSCCAHF